MLHITVIAIGKLKERFWVDACKEYLKRLSAYANVSIKELPDVDPARCGGEAAEIKAESESIIDNIPKGSASFLLDISGKLVSSEDLAETIDDCAVGGINDLCFIIGGSCGVNDDVRHAVAHRVSLGRITLPHNLARVVLLEQLFRAFKIIKGEPYHK